MEIYYDDILLDLETDEVVPITKQVNDVGNLDNLYGDFTREFKVKRTRRMNSLFDNAGEISSQTTVPYLALDVSVVQGGVQVIPSGKMSINNVDDFYFYVSIYSGAKNVFDQLKERKITDIDLTDLNHTWTAEVAKDSVVSNKDYQYLLADFSDDGRIIQEPTLPDTNLFAIERILRPFVRVKRLFSEILSSLTFIADIYPTISDLGLAAYWPFDDGAGTTAADKSGNGKTATFAGAGSLSWIEGISGSAVGLMASSEQRMGHSLIAFADHIPHSYCLWVRWDGLRPSTYDEIVICGQSGILPFSIYLNPDFNYRTTSFNTIVSAENMPDVFDGEWHWVVWTVNNARKVTAYIDGKLINAVTLPGSSSIAYDTIGKGLPGSGYSWNGPIDEVRIYDRTLSTAEVKEWHDTYLRDPLFTEMFIPINTLKPPKEAVTTFLAQRRHEWESPMEGTALPLGNTVIYDNENVSTYWDYTARFDGKYFFSFSFMLFPGDKIEVEIDGVRETPDNSTSLYGTTLNVDMNVGEKVRFFFIREFSPFPLMVNYRFTCYNIEATRIGLDSPVFIANHLPPIDQAEFIKSICRYFGLIPDYDMGVLRLWSINRVITNKRIAKDWSHYLSVDDSRMSYRLDYARINHLKWKDDDDVQQGAGNAIIAVNDQNLAREKDIMTMPFAYCDQVRHSSEDMARIGWFESVEGTGEYKEKEKVTARIVLRDKVGIVVSYHDSSTSPDTEYDFTEGQCRKAIVAPLDLTTSVGYNDGIVHMLNNTKVKICKFNLPAIEIAGLDHSVPVFISQYDSYFFVKKVHNWIDGELCNVELIRI